MNKDLSIYLIIAAGVLVLIALYGNRLLKGAAALWVTSP